MGAGVRRAEAHRGEQKILVLINNVDAMVTTSAALAEPGSTGPLERLPAIRNGRLFDVHRRSRPENDACDWYESAVVEVDIHLPWERHVLHLNAVNAVIGAPFVMAILLRSRNMRSMDS